METTIAIILGVVIVLVLIAVGYFLLRKRKTERLQSKFGPEYGRTVHEAGGETQKAEARLEQREKRVESFAVHPLAPADRERYGKKWQSVQKEFVDDPKGAIGAADELLTEVMAARGYPVGDFEQRSADLSVDHPVVVQNYRTAHKIAVSHARGQASTEDLRQAMLCYRALFDELVGELEQAAAED
jgi:hypothetical protein